MRAPVGLAFIDPGLRIVRINDSLAGFFGTDADKLIHQSLSALATPFADKLGPLVTEILEETREATSITQTLFDPQVQQERHFNAIIYPARSSSGDIVGVGAVAFDTTESTVEQRAERSEDARLALRKARAGEQAVRMQRVTAALSEAMTVDQVCSVLLNEGAGVVGAERGAIALLDSRRQRLMTMQTRGYTEEEESNWWQSLAIEDHYPLTDAVRNAQPILATSPEDLLSQWPELEAQMSATSTGALAVFPLVAHNQSIGAWALIWEEGRSFEEGELIILLTVASQCAQALERARLYERERFISASLQRTLLPEHLPVLRGATTARRYRASAAGVDVGGDWYDVIRLPGNRVGLVVGDVGGHNIDAAAIMGQLRNAVRSYSWEGHPAAGVMEATNHLLCGLEPGVMATCCYVDLSLDDGIASVAVAGHPPPLVVHPSAPAEFMTMEANLPFGTDVDTKYEQATLFLAPKDTLVLYTDGLVEERLLSVAAGMDRLASVGSRWGMAHPEDLATHLLHATQNQVQEDDIALLLLRYEPLETVVRDVGRRSMRRRLPSSPASAGVARRLVADVLRGWGPTELVETISLCLSELVTNALVHTATEIELILTWTVEHVRVEVIDQSDRMPVVLKEDRETSGRGLQIVDAVATKWGVESLASGKSVWCEFERSATT